MDRELVFAQTLKDVRDLARSQGNCIESKQVEAALARLELDEMQLQMVLDYLKEHKIGIDKLSNPEEYLSEEERGYLQDYLETIAALEVVSEGEKEAVILSAMAGDAQARSRLARIFIKDVPEIAKLYAGQGVLLEDLIGEGNVALARGIDLIGALEHADEASGMLCKMIMDAMEDYIALSAAHSQSDKKVADKVNNVMEKAKELAEDLSRKVTPLELSRETGMSLNSIMDAIRMSGFQIEYIEVKTDE